MSIFSGWEAGDFGRLREVLTESPQGLMMLVVFVLILIALVFLLVQIISHQISGFYVRISGEEEEDGDEPEEKVTGSPDKLPVDPPGIVSANAQTGRLSEPGQGREAAENDRPETGKAAENDGHVGNDSERNGEVLS